MEFGPGLGLSVRLPEPTGRCGHSSGVRCRGPPSTLGVGWLDDSDSNALPNWQMALGDASSHQPHARAWGDYLDIQPDPRRKTYWMRPPLLFREVGEGQIFFRRF